MTSKDKTSTIGPDERVTLANPGGLEGKHIVLGVCSGIAAYKAPHIVRGLRAQGAAVQVVLTDNADRFVARASLQAVSAQPVRQSLWDESAEAAMGHIELARWADLILIAPTTANTLAALVQGRAGDLLTTLCLATTAPILLAPAMNQQMYQHAATQKNLKLAADLGYQFIGPNSGEQACGEEGPGRMSEPESLVQAATQLLDAKKQTMTGLRVVVTAGPTVEAIDPVRFISNHSSGKQGLALAMAASQQGAEVTLIAGPGVPPSEQQITRLDVVSALDMEDSVKAAVVDADIFIGVAAVADYRPVEAHSEKMKRAGEKNARLQIELQENPDIIAGVAALASPPLVIGFAAETNNTLEHARAKLKRKGLDAIVLNDVSRPDIGFNSNHNAATLIHQDGEIDFPLQSKSQLSENLLAQICSIFANRLATSTRQSVSK